MRKIGFTKYRKGIKEIMPKSYQIEKKTAQRRLFFSLINEYLDPSLQISLRDSKLFENDILNIFINKILSQFQIHRLRPERAQRVVKIFHYENALFNQFFKQCIHPKARYLARDWEFDQNFSMLAGYNHPVAKLIVMLFDGKDVNLMLDLDLLFTETVYRRIKQEVGKTVQLDAPYIHIDENGHRTRLHPRWKRVNPENLEQRAKQIDRGFEQLQNEDIDQMYLIYPKTENFRQHIKIKTKDNYELKMIPYSFTYTNRKGKQCQK
jgi:hypothetical protein